MLLFHRTAFHWRNNVCVSVFPLLQICIHVNRLLARSRYVIVVWKLLRYGGAIVWTNSGARQTFYAARSYVFKQCNIIENTVFCLLPKCQRHFFFIGFERIRSNCTFRSTCPICKSGSFVVDDFAIRLLFPSAHRAAETVIVSLKPLKRSWDGWVVSLSLSLYIYICFSYDVCACALRDSCMCRWKNQSRRLVIVSLSFRYVSRLKL